MWLNLLLLEISGVIMVKLKTGYLTRIDTQLHIYIAESFVTLTAETWSLNFSSLIIF